MANSFILFERVDRPLLLVIALLTAYGHLATWSLPIIHFEDAPKYESNAAVHEARGSLRRSDVHASVTGVTSLGTVEHNALLVDVIHARQATCKYVFRKLQLHAFIEDSRGSPRRQFQAPLSGITGHS